MAPPKDWTPNDWTTTARLLGPRLLHLVAKLRDITEIDRDFVARHAISALLWDVDGTLMPHHHRLIAPELEAILTSLQGYLPQAILSNFGETRLLGPRAGRRLRRRLRGAAIRKLRGSSSAVNSTPSRAISTDNPSDDPTNLSTQFTIAGMWKFSHSGVVFRRFCGWFQR